MQRHFEDPEVFIRSLATRGALGGLSRSAPDVVRVLEAWGAERILIETVGVGQDELDVARTAHSTVVVVAPGLGDGVQAMKAGIAECADVFAVNKADSPGADAAVADLQTMLALGHESLAAAPHGHSAALAQATTTDERWTPPIVRTVATRAEGVEELYDALGRHRVWLQSTDAGRVERLGRVRERLVGRVRDAVADAALERLRDAIAATAERVSRGEIDLEAAVDQLLGQGWDP
jgi:LAO/AO transport system kinase